MSDGKTLMEIFGYGTAAPEPVDLADCMTWSDAQWADHDASVDARKQAERGEIAARSGEQLIKEMERAGWSRRALDAAMIANDQSPSITRLCSVDLRDRNVIVMGGRPGCGKTVGVAWWAMRRKTPPAFVRSSTFATTSRYSDREKRAEWFGASAFVLDDLGTEYMDVKGSLLSDLDELVDHFYSSRRPLIITTNITAKDMRDRYGARIADRLRECGRWLDCDGPSYRRKDA